MAVLRRVLVVVALGALAYLAFSAVRRCCREMCADDTAVDPGTRAVAA